MENNSFVKSIESICGGSPFWNDSSVLHATGLHLTPCFLHTALVWLPCVFLFFWLPFFVLTSLKSRDLSLPWKKLLIARVVFSGLLLIVTGFRFACALIWMFVYRQGISTADCLAVFLLFLAMGTIFGMHLLCRWKGVISSGVIFLSSFLFLLFGSFEFAYCLGDLFTGISAPNALNIGYLLYIVLLAVLFVLNCFADKVAPYVPAQDLQQACPEQHSSFLNRLTFWWFSSLMVRGWKRPLVNSDVWNLNSCDTSESLRKTWESVWNPVFKRYMKKKLLSHDNSVSFDYSSDPVKDPEITFSKTRKQSAAKVSHPSVAWRIFLCFKWRIVSALCLKTIADALQFVSPQLLKLLINFIETSTEPLWYGVFFAVGIFIISMLYTLLLHQYFHIVFRLGMNARSILVSAVFNKSLRLSNRARQNSTIGEVVNLMSVDVQRVTDVSSYMLLVLSAPFQVVLSLLFLWQILGPSVLAGVAVLVILIPVNFWLSMMQRRFQVTQMKRKDERLKVMNEVFSGIKLFLLYVLKMYAWEPAFQEKVLQIRRQELNVLKKSIYYSAVSSLTWMTAPFLVAVATFAAYVLSNPSNVLTPQKAFVSLALFNILRFPMSMLPMLISFIVQAYVSLKRLRTFLVGDELDLDVVQRNQHQEAAIVISDATFNWNSTRSEPTLCDINLQVMPGRCVAVVGHVGSGKSSLISAMLGEIDRTSGTVSIKGSIAYVPQQAWIQNMTLKQNVLFSKVHKEDLYKKVIHACALDQDLKTFPGGDETEIGERGINLSGGQKQRVSLARAIYQNTDIYLLDDPLSAVDSHVSRHIFQNVISNEGLLRNKTRVLVTNDLSCLKHMDTVLVIKNGRISESGSYAELISKKGDFADLLEKFLSEKAAMHTSESSPLLEQMFHDIVKVDPSATERMKLSRSLSHEDSESQKRLLTASSKSGEDVAMSPGKDEGAQQKLIHTERAETGKVDWAVYRVYARSIGYLSLIFVSLFYVGSGAFNIGSNMWLASWSDDALVNETQRVSSHERLAVYAVLGISQGISIFLASLIMAFVMVRASQRLHEGLLTNLLRSPLAFYDITPVGRIVNRVGKDIDVLDNTLPMTVRSWIGCVVSVVATLLVIVITTPIFIFVVVPLGILYYYVQRFYVSTSRQLKRLESVSRSPIYSHFQESLQGVSSIRAYNVQERFIKDSEKKVDENQVFYYPSIVSNRWLAVRLEFVGNFLVFAAALFAVISRGWSTVTAGLVGLSISYAMSITQTLNWAVRMSSELETNVVAVERIKEYTETSTEKEWVLARRPDDSWPSEGAVVVDRLYFRYREGMDCVLKNINFSIYGGEKIGVVGRTGAGKSSLALALFRIAEPAEGRILIDHVDTASIGLHDLRNKLSIIPQEPTLFCGTLRSNLDPFNKSDDASLWAVLEQAHLKTFVSSLPEKLSYAIAEGGENLSVGQRQLVCLARALLRNSKILVMDEATAAVDVETDDLIQKTIRTCFKECTIITIAHRLNTIMDSDRILVLNKGEIAEFGRPDELLQNEKSLFHGMAKEANLI